MSLLTAAAAMSLWLIFEDGSYQHQEDFPDLDACISGAWGALAGDAGIWPPAFQPACFKKGEKPCLNHDPNTPTRTYMIVGACGPNFDPDTSEPTVNCVEIDCSNEAVE